MRIKDFDQFILQLETQMQKLGNFKSYKELCFKVLSLLFMGGLKILIIKIRI